ncbi:MAG TPA: tRNA (adenosine(37)-N6)-dimethylallyltransferase MiaA [Mariprofundaceae bacterium]|nr:tRNA (adenosine(37)-N6)-dimethylallyltransferase MiaA [Mariprofundaceae bacterium]
MGATGVGKSALALELAAKTGNAIISCDSMQVYRGLDIGTAKPSGEERARVAHYLVDCADIREVYSAARWATEARQAIRTENAAGRVPLICGGTGLYLKALMSGLADIPPEDAGVRERLAAELAEYGVRAMHAQLAAVDARMAARLHATDTQRILRALAVFRTTGRPLSAWQAEAGDSKPIDFPVFVLELPRDLLRDRLDLRFRAMIGSGWLDEVRWLAAQNLPDTHPAMRAVGYRQLLAVLRGEMPMEQGIQAGITATRRYAKRQETWFRGQVQGIHGDAAALRPRILEAVRHGA